MTTSINPGPKTTPVSIVHYCKKLLSLLVFFFSVAAFQNTASAAPPGVPDLSHPGTKLVVIIDSSIADNISKNKIRAYVVDSDGNPVNGAVVYFTLQPGNVTISVSTSVTPDGPGIADLEVASGTVGPVTITARIGSVNFTNPEIAYFVAYVPDVTNDQTRLEVNHTGAIPNGTATNSVRAIILDSGGNPVPNQLVSFQIQTGTGTFTVMPAEAYTDANGVAIIYLTSSTPGNVVVTASVGGTPVNDAETVEFILNTPDTSVPTTRLERVKDGSLADGTDANIVRAVITDAAGNPVPNQAVVFSLTGNGSFTTPVTVYTDVNGIAIATLVSNTPGPANVTATVNSSPIHPNPLTVVFVSDPPVTNTPSTYLITVDDGALANGTASNSVRAHITDINGNPVAGQLVTFAISGSALPVGFLTVFTDANGDATLRLTSTTPGSVDLSAEVNGTPLENGNPSTVVFVQFPPNVAVSTTRLLVVTTGSVADSAAVNTVKAVITDVNGLPVSNQRVIFSKTGTAGFTSSDTVYTDINGEAYISMVSVVAGVVHVTATVNGTPIINGSPAAVTFVAGVADLGNPRTELIVDSDSARANGVATNMVRAHIVDAFGNPVAGQVVTFAITSGTATTSALTVTTDSNGDAVITMTSTTVGDVIITAEANGTPLLNGNPATATFVLFADVSNPATEIIVMTDNALANGTATNTVRAHVVDNNGNPLAGKEVIFTIASGEATIVTPQPVITDLNGDAIIVLTSTKAGVVTITATADGDAIIHGSPARIRFTEENVWVPAVFTPNGDGTNDVVRPIITGVFNMQYFNIYNRWGNLVFTSTNVVNGWDGRMKGVMQPNETYLWIIGGTDSANQRVQKRGMLSLVR